MSLSTRLPDVMKRALITVVGLTLLFSGILMPQGWYYSLPFDLQLASPPFPGIWILQFCLVVEGLILLAIGFTRATFSPLPPASLPLSPVDETPQDLSSSSATVLLIAITVVASVLRLYHFDNCLWLDEISPIVYYGRSSFLELFTVYYSTNLHLLNTFLIKLLVPIFGDQVVRVPAIFFGVATIPVFYWTVRQAYSRKLSLAAAFLLAVAYHHVFFSQNARGYTAYIFFSLAATGLLISAFKKDDWRTWFLYVLAMLGSFASLIVSVFTLISHVVIVLAAGLALSMRGDSPLPFLRRAFGILIIAGLLGLQLYSIMLPQAYVVFKNTYTVAASGYTLTSLDFVEELFRGLLFGLSPGLVVTALPLAALVIFGCCLTAKRSWPLLLGFSLPPLLLFLFFIVQHHSGAPRFFVFAIPGGYFAFVVALAGLSSLLSKRSPAFSKTMVVGGMVLCALVSVWPLAGYYRVPKQDYLQAVETIKTIKRPGKVAIIVYYAEVGFTYYAQRCGLKENRDFFLVRSAEKFDKLIEKYGRENVDIVTTFHRPLRRDHPELLERIEENWQVSKTCAGTIGGGDLLVWSAKPQTASCQTGKISEPF